MSTVQDRITAIAALVGESDIIDHGTIRCLWDNRAVRQIAEAECIDESEVGTGTIGDNALAERLRDVDASTIDADTLASVMRAWRGPNPDDYVDREKENELVALDRLIKAARAI